MQILATVRENDSFEGKSRLIFLGYEECAGEDFPVMYLGVVDNTSIGQDDTTFCFVRTADNVLAEIERRWSDWKTFRYLPEPVSTETFYEKSGENG